MKSKEIKFNVIYSDSVAPESITSEKYIKFITHLVNIFKEQKDVFPYINIESGTIEDNKQAKGIVRHV